MAKVKKTKTAKKSARTTKRKTIIEYNSLTFLLFLVFVLAFSLLLITKIL